MIRPIEPQGQREVACGSRKLVRSLVFSRRIVMEEDEFPGKAQEVCDIFKQMLFDKSVADRIIEGLQKAGMQVYASSTIQIPKTVRKVG